MRLNEEKCNNRILMHFGTALLLSQPETVHEKEIIFCCISRMYVFAQMSRKLVTERSGMFLVKEKKAGGGWVGRDQNEPYFKMVPFSPSQSEGDDE